MKKKDIIKSLKFAKTMNEFIDYVYSFYGEDGVYDMGATRDNITTATIDYISSVSSTIDMHKKYFIYVLYYVLVLLNY